ncbi:hypothetical protein [uncultured Halomonas sp.]|uniref:hypothetical protein n=1 Tax=uncultured Halomonas sp. TaxID=173971 RepID=UPI00261ABB1E|nr:hypothetical protein [uncultured Halomonas sp.]
MPAKTCSEACRVARASRRERERYERIKDTEHFRATRAAYLERLAQAMDADPELAESIRDDHRRAVRAWRERQMADPALRARYLEAQRKREAKRLEKIRSDPDAYAEHLRKQREWYHSLSGDDYQRIFRANEAQPASYRRWSEDDDRFIVDNQPFHTISWIAEQLGRTESSVTSRMQRLGISLKRREGHKRAEWASEGLAMLGKVPDVDIAEKLGISKQAVHKKRKRLGIKPCRSRKHSK